MTLHEETKRFSRNFPFYNVNIFNNFSKIFLRFNETSL